LNKSCWVHFWRRFWINVVLWCHKQWTQTYPLQYNWWIYIYDDQFDCQFQMGNWMFIVKVGPIIVIENIKTFFVVWNLFPCMVFKSSFIYRCQQAWKTKNYWNLKWLLVTFLGHNLLERCNHINTNHKWPLLIFLFVSKSVIMLQVIKKIH
jgi:hypothetical protein